MNTLDIAAWSDVQKLFEARHRAPPYQEMFFIYLKPTVIVTPIAKISHLSQETICVSFVPGRHSLVFRDGVDRLDGGEESIMVLAQMMRRGEKGWGHDGMQLIDIGFSKPRILRSTCFDFELPARTKGMICGCEHLW